jgi:hypothetical protein
LVGLADDEAVLPVIHQGKLGPATRQENAATLRAHHIDCGSGEVLRCGKTSEAHIYGRRASVEECQQLRRKRPLIWQDPRAGLHDIDLRRLPPGCKHRVCSEPRPIGIDVIAHVLDIR